MEETFLFKGEALEETLRYYFLNLGYYVARGVQYKFEGLDLTDIDLFLYGRNSTLERQRINVDIKNKKSPQAFERIVWANGLRKLLNFNGCVVATTDRRISLHSFGKMHDTIILDGAFLSKLKTNATIARLSEEDLLARLAQWKSLKTFNLGWKIIYQNSKAKLLTELDFSGFNDALFLLSYFVEKFVTDRQKTSEALRMIYLVLSHSLIICDFLMRDVAFLDATHRERKLADGLNFGNLGKSGVDRIVEMANAIAGVSSASPVYAVAELHRIKILTEYFSKFDNTKNLFQWAKELEELGFQKDVLHPEHVAPHLKGLLGVLLDYFEINRKKFYEVQI